MTSQRGEFPEGEGTSPSIIMVTGKRRREAGEAWRRARSALGETTGPLPISDRRALADRAEREHRRRLDELRAAETRRYAEKDRAVADLRRRAEVHVRRKLVATAWWRCT